MWFSAAGSLFFSQGLHECCLFDCASRVALWFVLGWSSVLWSAGLVMSHFVTLHVFGASLQPAGMETLDLLRNCSVCKWELRRREPRMLPCLHSFCKDCLPDLIQGYSWIPTEYEVLYEGNISKSLACALCNTELWKEMDWEVHFESYSSTALF